MRIEILTQQAPSLNRENSRLMNDRDGVFNTHNLPQKFGHKKLFFRHDTPTERKSAFNIKIIHSIIFKIKKNY